MKEKLQQMSKDNLKLILSTMTAHDITELYVHVDKRGKVKCLLTDTIAGSFHVKRSMVAFMLQGESRLAQC